jgi:hypothetical protein
MAAGPLTRRKGLQPFQCELLRMPLPRTRVNTTRSSTGDP